MDCDASYLFIGMPNGSKANRISIMNRHKQAPSDFFVGADWGTAFRARVVGAIPAMPVVISRRLDCASEGIKALRNWPHWLSGFIACQAGVPESRSPTTATTAKRTADCSRYLAAGWR